MKSAGSSAPQGQVKTNITDWRVVEKTPEAHINERYGLAANKLNHWKLGNQYGPAINIPIVGFEKLRFQNAQLR